MRLWTKKITGPPSEAVTALPAGQTTKWRCRKPGLMGEFVFTWSRCLPRKSAAPGHEGSIKVKMQPTKGDPQFITYAMKGHRLRTEMPVGKETMVGLLD